MSASHAMVAPKVESIEQVVQRFTSSQVVEVTNKRIIIRCPNKTISRRLGNLINDLGHAIEIQKGKISNAMYIQAWL